MKGVKAILLAAGNGRRFNSSIPKQFHYLADKPLYRHSYDTMLDSCLFEEVIVVCHPNWVHQLDIPTISGGKTRQESVYLGLVAAGVDTKIIVIHDAARPFVTHKILHDNIKAAYTYGACNTCILSTDTLITTTDGRTISHIPNRNTMRRGQTPQSFQYDLIFRTHQTTNLSEATDDCTLVSDLGHPIHIVEGDEKNIKVTTELDFILALAITNEYNLKAT